MAKTIPYGGGSDYSALIREGYAYVDKTMFIEKLERDPRLISFFRPRRFGKSLFISTLEYYYDYKHADEFATLFGNTYIGSNPTPRRNSFAILKLNFSGINTANQESLESSFSNAVAESIALFIEENQIALNNPIEFNKSSAIIMNQFFKRAAKRFKYPLYLIIDEYDHYANEILSSNTGVFKSVMSAGGFIRTFFEVIKEAADSNIVSRLFMTGVSPVSLDSLTSGFNITNNITLNDNYHDLAGFTKEEVGWLADEALSCSAPKKDAIIKELELLYDGYRFSPYSPSKLFNSSMALYYLFQCASLGRPPMDFLDPNILSDYKKMQSIASIDLGKTKDASLEQREKAKAERLQAIMSISSGQKQTVVLTQVFELFAMSTDNFISLLFYLGYLTIHSAKGKKTVLAMPNAVIKDIFMDYFIDIAPSMGMDVRKAEKAMLQLAMDGKNDLFVEYVSDILHFASKRIYMRFDEESLQQMFYLTALPFTGYEVKIEAESPDGYLDLSLMPNAATLAHYFHVIEFKYLKVKKLTEGNVQKAWKEGLDQIKKYQQYPPYSDLDVQGKLKKWIIIFSTHQVVVNQEIVNASDPNLSMKPLIDLKLADEGKSEETDEEQASE